MNAQAHWVKAQQVMLVGVQAAATVAKALPSPGSPTHTLLPGKQQPSINGNQGWCSARAQQQQHMLVAWHEQHADRLAVSAGAFSSSAACLHMYAAVGNQLIAVVLAVWC